MINDHPPEDQIGAYLDHELPELEARAVALHLGGCATCAGLAEELRGVGDLVSAARIPADPAFRARLRAALATDAATRRPGFIGRLFGGWRNWLAASRAAVVPAGLAFAVVALVSSGATWLALDRGAAPSYLAHDLMTAHLRALAQGGAIQIASSDQHTVKPWFAGKVDVAPDARDLAADGFTLVGGRLDVIDGRRVAALVYKRRLHLIDVFAWPAEGGSPAGPSFRRERGYGLLSWSKAGVTYWAVSDLDPAELRRLAELL